MTLEQLSFITYCEGNLADALKMAPGKVYRLLRSSGVLNDSFRDMTSYTHSAKIT